MTDDRTDTAGEIGRLLGDRLLGCAESFTAGQLAQAFAAAEGSGDWFRGGVVAYRREVKHDVLHVPPGPLVNETTAVAMARGVAELLGVDVAVASTGAAGPDGLDGAPPGTVVIGWIVDGATGARSLHLEGDPAEVCGRGTEAALDLLRAALAADAAAT
ncbi:CinA family protein [Actinomarinicola tropica]|uniref:Nicotinamide-nucleotide amidohydrolase family protein n=1 Tax=Actinomarinicola tropica TaxID=2789776 RepID=A0A5Q2RQV9_9ACTN|nr:CinA family protein [Actinomarinicola tropica]QGG96527.1 nicotinamide-nucleotide amidohydrolase family protein [Actinomarinicola tropica]